MLQTHWDSISWFVGPLDVTWEKFLKLKKRGKKKKNQIKSKFVFVFLRECAEQTYSAIQNRKLNPV